MGYFRRKGRKRSPGVTIYEVRLTISITDLQRPEHRYLRFARYALRWRKDGNRRGDLIAFSGARITRSGGLAVLEERVFAAFESRKAAEPGTSAAGPGRKPGVVGQ